jgi:hypothetical protein
VAPTKPYDASKVLTALAKGATPKEHEGKQYHLDAGTGMAYYPQSDRLFVFGREQAVKQLLAGAAEKAAGPLSDGLSQAAQWHHAVAAGHLPGPILQFVKPQLPVAAKPYEALLNVTSATLIVEAGAELAADLQLRFPDEAGAKNAEAAARSAVALGRQALDQFKQKMANGPEARQMGPLFNTFGSLLDNLPIEQKGSDVHASLKADLVTTLTAVAMLVPAVQRVREAANQTKTSNNLKRIGLAMHQYHDVFGHFPPAVVLSKEGKPLYSWRLALLPYLDGGDRLCQEFHPDEPWDSPHNVKLLSRMPKEYALEGVPTANPGDTFFQVFVGPQAPFEAGRKPTLASFTDGLANTLLVVEAANAVPWTKPVDLLFKADGPLPLGRHYSSGPLVLLADGSVRSLSAKMSEKTIRAAITPAGGEVLPPDWDQGPK